MSLTTTDTLYVTASLLFVLTTLAAVVPVHLFDWWTGRRESSRSKSNTLKSNPESVDSSSSTSSTSSPSPPNSILTKDRVIHSLAQLSAGILLYTVTIHMLPETRANYQSYLNSTNQTATAEPDNEFTAKLVDFTACAGFFAIFLVQELAGRFLLNPNESTDESTDSSTFWAHLKSALLLNLSFTCDALLDGISIGVQQSAADVWTVAIAILAQKLLIAFVLAVQIHHRCVQQRRSPLTPDGATNSNTALIVVWSFAVLFASLSPIGILIMIAVRSGSVSSDSSLALPMVVLGSLGAGNIVYIVFVELVQKSGEVRQHLSGLFQWIVLVVGFVAMHGVRLLIR